jgi:hypothetical protein
LNQQQVEAKPEPKVVVVEQPIQPVEPVKKVSAVVVEKKEPLTANIEK